MGMEEDHRILLINSLFLIPVIIDNLLTVTLLQLIIHLDLLKLINKEIT